MTALVVDPKPVRAKVSRYQIQRLGIHVELVLDLNQGLSSISNENKVVNMVFIEQEVWDKDSSISALFVNKLQKIVSGVSTKLFLLGNSLSSRTNTATSGVYTPSVITKPLKASMLAASLQRAMGGNKGNPCNGEHPSLSLRKLLVGRKMLIVDDNKVNLMVAAAALKKYGADVVCADGGQKAIKLLKPPHKFDACFMDIQMPEMDGYVMLHTFKILVLDFFKFVVNF
jgi:histidine kinase 2/3/4 (cytokinin receptor)